MTIHHTKHHQGYIDKLNTALEGNEEFGGNNIEELIKSIDKLPDEIQKRVINNGGGHLNHSMFWEIMAPGTGGEPHGTLKESITSTFSDFNSFKDKFKEAALERFGSGWVWLIINNNKLDIVSTANQDNPLMQQLYPLMGIDVWEHAYYLKYQNIRAEYVDAWWNVVNWREIENRFKKQTVHK